MSGDGFDSEAFKLMIADIGTAEEIATGTFQIKLSSRDLQLDPGAASKTLILKLVWIQGNIKEIREEGSDTGRVIVIQDGSGEAVIAGCDAIPGGDHTDIKRGGYIGILGQVCATAPTIYIKAVKIMVLNENPLLRTMWPDEVKDLKSFLLGHYSSWNENTA